MQDEVTSRCIAAVIVKHIMQATYLRYLRQAPFHRSRPTGRVGNTGAPSGKGTRERRSNRLEKLRKLAISVPPISSIVRIARQLLKTYR